MATNFSFAEDICEGVDCKAVTNVTYSVKEKKKKKLCKDCASKEGCIGKEKNSGPNLHCEKHDEEMKFYCKTHGESLCSSCARIDHQQPCVQQVIEGAMMKLQGLKEKAKDQLQLCRAHRDQIRLCRQTADTHLQTLKDEVDSVFDEAMNTDKDRELGDAANINQTIDKKNQILQEEIQKINGKIQKNNKKRDKLLELNRRKAQKRQEPINNKQRALQTDIQNIAEECERKIGELEKSWQDHTKSIENTIQTLATVLEDDKNVVKDGHRVNTSIADELQKPLDEGGVKHITRTVSGVRFMKGDRRGKYNGRIGGYDGEWKLIDTINVTDEITHPALVGCIDEYDVIIRNRKSDSSNPHTYLLDINTKRIKRVKTSRGKSWVMSCALLNDDKVVCGKLRMRCRGDSLTGWITVYDRQWKLINDVTIPRNTTDDITWVNVAADLDGMIIAAENGQSKIYVINPVDNKIMNTITCKENIVMNGVLSSGHIIAQPSPVDHRVFIIDREGVQREISHSGVIWNVCIDPMTDDLYVATSDDEYKTYVIDQLMSGGDMKKRRVASFPRLTRRRKEYESYEQLRSPLVTMMSSGNLIACDDVNILVFKNLLIV